MENIDSNMQPQPTGGLKLMTVFVVVLALHVVVIGGMTAYYLLKGGSADTSMADGKQKGLKANADGSLAVDNTLPDADKTTPAPATETSTSATTASASTPAPDQAAPSEVTSTPTESVASKPTAAVAPTPSALTPPPDAPTPAVATKSSPSVTTSDVKASTAITPAVTTTPVTPDVTQTTPASTTGGTAYTVVSHDSLAKIAHKNHISVANLMAANSMTSDKLSIGQKLVIPAKTPAPVALGTAEATGPETASADVSKTAPVALAKETASAPAPEKKAKTVATTKPAPAKVVADKHTYTIVKGDTLTKIAHKFKTTPSALMAVNNIADPTKLKIGNKLTIPKESHAATTVESAPQIKTKKDAAQLANVTQ